MPGGKPAARIGDMHICPAWTGLVPHVGGPVSTGSPNVFIGGLPAGRVSDIAICAGPPDMVVTGSASVFINGRPAARMGDHTAHGGVVVVGIPTVLIGDTGGWDTELGMAVEDDAQVEALTQAASAGKAFCKICPGT